MTPGARVELERIDPAENAKRSYTMTVTPDPQLALFDGDVVEDALLLVVAYGRIGTRLRVGRKRFASAEKLAAHWRRLLAIRRRHGYVVTREEWPDGSWLRAGARP